MIIIFTIVALFISFTVQTVFLTLALWIMIRVQDLNYNFPGLLGSAALACGVDIILNLALQPWFDGMAIYISAPFFLGVLYYCVQKVTEADLVDVSFTIVVGGALRFGMNLFLIGALMGDLRPSDRNSDKYGASTPESETNEIHQIVATTNRPATNAPAKRTTQSKPGQTAGAATSLISVKGVTQSGSRVAVTIQTGKRTYNILLGEAAMAQTAGGPVSVRFKQLGDGWVLLAIDGQDTKLPFH